MDNHYSMDEKMRSQTTTSTGMDEESYNHFHCGMDEESYNHFLCGMDEESDNHFHWYG